MAANGGAAAAAAAAIANAIKASGILVQVTPEDFRALAGRAQDALVVHASSHFFGTRYKYLLAY